MTKKSSRIGIFAFLVFFFAFLAALPKCVRAEDMGTVTVKVKQDYTKAQEILKYVNIERTSRGLSPLVLTTELTSAAMQRAAELAVYIPESSPHLRPNGQRVNSLNSGICWENAQEWFWESYGWDGLTRSTRSAEKIVESWMNSESHKQGILTASHRTVGIGACQVVSSSRPSELYTMEFSTSSGGTVLSRKGVKTASRVITAKSEYLAKKYFKLTADYYDGMYVKKGSKISCEVLFENNYGEEICLTASQFSWGSTNTKVASVSKSGVITIKKPGKFTIVAVKKSSPRIKLKLKLRIKKQYGIYTISKMA